MMHLQPQRPRLNTRSRALPAPALLVLVDGVMAAETVIERQVRQEAARYRHPRLQQLEIAACILDLARNPQIHVLDVVSQVRDPILAPNALAVAARTLNLHVPGLVERIGLELKYETRMARPHDHMRREFITSAHMAGKAKFRSAQWLLARIHALTGGGGGGHRFPW